MESQRYDAFAVLWVVAAFIAAGVATNIIGLAVLLIDF